MENVNLPVLASANGIDLFGVGQIQWVDGETVGRKLGYKNPRTAMIQLFNRHKNEFKEGETCVLNLSTEINRQKGAKPYSQEREIRLFSVPNGALRLCMLSNAPNRVEIQSAILQVFDAYRFGVALQGIQVGHVTLLSEWYIRELKRRLGRNTANKTITACLKGTFNGQDYRISEQDLLKLPDGHIKGAAMKKYSATIGKSLGTAYRQLNRLAATLNIPRQPTKKTGLPKKIRNDKGTTRHPEAREAVYKFIEEHPGARGVEIRTALGLTIWANTINQWIRHRESLVPIIN